MGYTIIFATACIGLVLTAAVWAGWLVKIKRTSAAQLIGPAGALCASIPILGAWMPETFQPMWLVVQATCAFWLLSFLLIGLAVLFAFTLDADKRVRIAAVVCGGAAFLFNGTALLAFLWYATVAPGGV